MNKNKNFNPYDIIGQHSGRLKIIEYVGYYSNNDNPYKYYWYKCLCNCGNYKICRRSVLISLKTRSCGCISIEVNHNQKYGLKHNLSRTRIYRIWINMRLRCNNPKDTTYKYYGAKGIKVCNEWNKDFIVFYKWSMKNGYNDHLTLDRIDGTKDYCPENCRWATMKEQSVNKCSNKLFKAISPSGKEYVKNIQTEFAKEHNLDASCINNCLNNRLKTHKGWKFNYL